MILESIIMGVVEGITEFLPISSTGHLIIVNNFIKFEEPFASMFEVVIQLGAILSVIVYFRNRLVPLGKDVDEQKRKDTFDLWKKTVAGVIPAILIGGTIGKAIQK
ncbi:MAG: undecaprenyl-diphosphate phosphatase, partial [Rectinemataceae bacterium]|nr:undecaprenyl-diphosphate phosphatase [Rectinemataceae bacterium]